MGSPVPESQPVLSPSAEDRPSAAQHNDSRASLRAWLALIQLSWQRQMRAREMVWIALALLVLSVAIVGLQTAAGRWGMHQWKFYGRAGPTYVEWIQQTEVVWRAIPYDNPASAVWGAVNAAQTAILSRSDFVVFTKGFLFLIFLSFLLPLWSLSFATEALGGERENQSLIWLLTRPLPRPAIYLGKFLAMLPWCLALNLGGFTLICLVAGRPGYLSLPLFWPAVLCASLAFAALFFLVGAFFRRPAVVAIVYSFFLEVIMGNMPGSLKRLSISFYARCMMFEAAESEGLQPENPLVYDPVSGTTAVFVLLGLTGLFLLTGMLLFKRTEYAPGD